MNNEREQKWQSDREKNHAEMRWAPGVEFRGRIHDKIENVVAAFVSNAELNKQALGTSASTTSSRAARARSANEPEIARDHVRDPSEMIWQAFGRCFALVHGHDEQIGFDRIDEVRRRESGVAAKWMERTLFLQRAGDDKIDIVVGDCPQDSIGRVSLTIMDRRIARQLQPAKYFLEFLCRLVVPFADVDQAQICAEPLANSSRLGKHLLKARRECASDGNLLVGGRIHHEPEQQCPALRIVRQMNASNVRHGESVRLTDLILWFDD